MLTRRPYRVACATLALLCSLPACGPSLVGPLKRPLLREYRPRAPRAQLAEPVWLASFTTDELGGRLAPDGKRLLYAGNQKGNLDIWLKDLTTGFPSRLTSHVATDTQPAWSPDGRRVAFVSMRHDVKGDIFLWSAGKITRLTGRATADAFPAWSPDGEALFFVSGPDERSRVVRMDLARALGGDADRPAVTPVTGWGTTHPAVSPDGRLLAYTQFDATGQGRVAVLRLGPAQKPRLLTTPEYHAGFPAFSRDSQRLVYSRFYSGRPNRPLEQDAMASLWEVGLVRALAAAGAAQAQQQARPLTSGSGTALFAQLTGAGLVLTTRRAGSLDIGLLPADGPVPRLRSPAAQLALALAQENTRDRLLCLRRTVALGPSPQASRALYLMARIHAGLGELDKAARVLARLVRDSALTHGDYAYLAQIDAAVLAVAGAPQQLAARARQALARLDRLKLPRDPSRLVAAHLLLRRGDVHRAGGQHRQAMARYEALLRQYPEQRETAVEAKFQLGALLHKVQDRDLLSAYYLTLFRDFPGQPRWLRKTAAAVLALNHEPAAPLLEVERLRALTGVHRARTLFVASAQLRIARIYEEQKQIPLAIQAMHLVTRLPGKQVQRERTRAAFHLGRLSLEYSDQMRKARRMSEALGFYEKALGAYETIMKAYESGHENHARARAEYMRLSLLDGAQRERQGELALAEKRYRKIIARDPQMVQAHRKLIQFGVARGQRAALVSKYQARVTRDPGDMVGHYGLGYLETLGRPVTAARLERAQQHLRRAASLNPQSPFPHLTLGWIHEMRERLLGQTHRGWLEESILLYDRALGLNDQQVDIQTEADLLLNLCNAFAHLGNGWKQAHEFCGRRQRLSIPFLSKARRALYHLTFGRAATAVGASDQAIGELEQALDLARSLGKGQLEAEVLARVALTAHLQGNRERAARRQQRAAELYARSNRYLARAARYYEGHGQAVRLAGIYRSMAYNLSLMNQPDRALATLLKSKRALTKHGAPTIEPMTRIGPAGRTTAPFGFDALDETYLALAIRGRIYQRAGAWPEVLPLLQRRLENRAQALKQREKKDRAEDTELKREMILLRNHQAVAGLRLGRQAASRRALGQALRQARALQQKDGKGPYKPDAQTFELELALALNAAEELLASLTVDGAADRQQLGQILALLARLERARAAHAKQQGKQLLSERSRLALWSNLAQLLFHGARLGLPLPQGLVRPRTVWPGAGKGGQAMAALLKQGEPFTEAVRLLRQVARATDLARPLKEPALASGGVMAAVRRPLTPAQRLRWHLLAKINLAEIATAFTPREALAAHPSTRSLSALAALGVKHELGALKFVVAAELAHRRGSRQAMDAAVRGFLQRSPLLLPRAYQGAGAALIRQRVLGRAVDLALHLRQPLAALAYAEQRERRAFVDALVQLPPAGIGRLTRPISRLLELSRLHRVHLSRQDPWTTGAPAKAWHAKLLVTERAVARQLAAVGRINPRVAQLFSAAGFPHKALVGALLPGDVALGAVVSGRQVVLVALSAGASEPATEVLGSDLPRLQGLLRASDTAGLGRALRPALARLTRGAKRIYIDLGRISEALSPRTLLPRVPVTRLATLWELVDAHRVRNLAFFGGAVADPRPAQATRLAQALALKPLTGGDLSLARALHRVEQAGVLIWSGPLRFDGGSAAAARLLMHDPGGKRLKDLRLGQRLGLPLRGHLLALTPRHTPGRTRQERVALTRLVHAAGVPSLLLLHPLPGRPFPPLALLKQVKQALGQQSLARALASAGARPGEVALYGHAGLPPDQAKIFARARLKQATKAGLRAFHRRRYPQAVEQLESALRLKQYLHDDKYMASLLGLLGRSYGLQKDYARALPLMERQLALLQRAVLQAREAGKKKALLKAQAKWVKALEGLAWTRLRNKQHDRALKANKQAIEFYHKLGRPLLAQGALTQRSIIAEQKGDLKQALEYAQRSLKMAREAQTRARSKIPGAAKVMSAALRLARVQRMRFSNYGQAMAAAKVALAQLSVVDARQLATTKAMVDQLAQRVVAASGKQKKFLARQLSTIRKMSRAMVALARKAVEVSLEISRIYSAQGDYRRAAEHARKVKQLATQYNLPTHGAALLEEVNNLYYQGAYALALVKARLGMQQVEALVKRAPTQGKLRKIQFFNAMGSVYAGLGRTDQAVKALQSARKIAIELEHTGEIATAHNNLGNAYRLAGRFATARAQFSQALAMEVRRKDRLGMAFARANLGLTDELMGRHRQARANLQRALTLSREIGAPLNELKALTGLGRLDLAAGGATRALKRFRQGLAIAARLGLRNWSWRFHLLAGRALRVLGRADKARAELERGIAVVEAAAPRLRPLPGAVRVDQQPEELYDELIDLLATQGKAEAAFDLCERMRARALVDLVSQSATRLPVPELATALSRVTGSQVELEAARSALSRAAAGKDRTTARARVSQLTGELATSRAALSALNPWLPAMVTVDAWPLSKLRPLVARLKDTRLVSYHPARRQLVIWILDSSGGKVTLTMKRVKVGRAKLAAAVRRFRAALSSYHKVDQPARQLHRWLLAPALGRRTSGRLLVVPGGPLHVLPFAALHDGKDYAVARWTMSHLASVNALRRHAAAQASVTKGANVSFSWAGPGPRPLLFAAREAGALRMALPGALVLEGQDATVQRFKAEAPGARLLHVATHGRFRPEAPLRTALDLADGPLEVLQVLGLRLRAGLVILSACQTGVGHLDGADSVVGLNRAFLAAGARRVISSLWRVSDLGTALLMKRLFRQLPQHAPAQALQRAQNQLRRRYPHPAFWAGFRLDGAP